MTGEKNCCKVIEKLEIYSKNVTICTSESLAKTRIISFHAENMEIHYFPKGIDSNFPNLQNLVIKNSKLQEIRADDLKVFRNLQFLDLSYNEIEVLGPNLFNCGFTILQVILNDNKIQFIHPTAFKPKDGLVYLDIKNNSCISVFADNKAKVNTLINLLKVSCPYYPLQIKELQEEVQTQKENFRIFESKIEKKLEVIFFLIGTLLASLVLVLICTKKKPTKTLQNKFANIKIDEEFTTQISLGDLRSENIYESYEGINHDSSLFNNSQVDDFYDSPRIIDDIDSIKNGIAYAVI